MSDFLLKLSANPSARRAVKALGLPLPLPAVLVRDAGAAQSKALAGRTAVLAESEHGRLGAVARAVLEAGGARLDDWAERVDLLVIDATGVSDLAGLRWLFERAQGGVRRVGRAGRVVVLADLVEESEGATQSAAVSAVEGFVRSVSKEIGRTGATANLLRVGRGAEERAGAALRWLLSQKSAFVTGQPLKVTTEASSNGGETAKVERALAGKTALVTGAARGIGEATARALAREGATVLCLDRPEDAEALTNVAQSIGGRAIGADLSRPDAVGSVLEALGETQLDVIVHNAGITRDKTLARMDPKQWDAVLGVNLDAVLALTEALAPRLRDGGRLIALSSVSGIAGNVGQTAYAASKAGVLGWVRALSKQLAPRGITVNAVAPGFIETRMTAAMPAMIREGARRLSALGQGGRPEDVAEAVTFLASPGAQGITGSTLRVCGGAFVGA